MSLLSVKVILMSTGILSMAMGLKLTVPAVSHFILNEAPTMWTFLLTCFTPPYLYLLLNFIILTIVASSKFHNHSHHQSPPEGPLPSSEPDIYSVAYVGTPAVVQIPSPQQVEIPVAAQTDFNGFVSGGYVYEAKTMPSDETVVEGNGSVAYVRDENTPVKTTVIGTEEDVKTPTLQKKELLEFAFNDENEKPPVSTRFSHRKAVRASPEGGKVVSLGVTKPKRQDTLESTWKAITEGRAMPLTRHLKKSETWETQHRRNASPLADLNGGGVPVMKKSDMFGGREKNASPSPSPGSGGRLRKEPSLSQDELNRRVEAFINKFNAEMRLQRQESLRQYREMINQGAC